MRGIMADLTKMESNFDDETPKKVAKRGKDEETSKMCKISDFFKTPDKQNDHKQKKLMQFFTKTNSKESTSISDETNKEDNSEKVCKDDDELSELTPTNSDKENSEVIVVDDSDSSFRITSDGKEKLQVTGHIEILDLSEQMLNQRDEKLSKKDLKTKNTKHRKVNRTQDIGKHTESSLMSNTNSKDKNNVGLRKDSEKESQQSVGSTATICSEACSDLEGEDRESNKERAVVLDIVSRKLDKDTVEETVRGKKNVNVERVIKLENRINVSNEQNTKFGKKGLKVKEMMNLLKEIKDSEKDGNKKKNKKKSKKKEKYKTDKLTHEISCSNSPEVVDLKCDLSSELTENKKKCKRNNVTPDDSKSREEAGCDNIKNHIKEPKNEENHTNDANMGKTDLAAKVEKGKRKKISRTAKSEAENLSYNNFSKDLTSKQDNSEMTLKTESNIKEMSYTEYLEQLEQSMSEDKNENEASDVEVEVIGNGKDDTEDEKITEGLDGSNKKNSEDKLGSEGVKNFFMVMTSTPDRLKAPTESDMRTYRKSGGKVKSKHTAAGLVEKETESDTEPVKVISVEMAKTNTGKSLPLGKKTQATLSFGKTGLTLTKPVSEPEKTEVDNSSQDASAVVNGKVVGKRGRPRKNLNAIVDSVVASAENTLDVTSDAFETPEKIGNRRNKRKVSEMVEEECTEDQGERRRSHRKRYKVEVFQMDADKKTPIKIKLRRCPKSSSSGEDGDGSKLKGKKQKSKHSTAQALLIKAKRGRPRKYNEVIKNRDKPVPKKPKVLTKRRKKTKERNASNSSEDSTCRRSSRLVGRTMASMEEVSLEDIIISSDADSENEDSLQEIRRRKKSKKKLKLGENMKLNPVSDKTVENDASEKMTPKKRNTKLKGSTPAKDKQSTATPNKRATPLKNRSPAKKPGARLAPLFLLGKKKSSESSPRKPPLDPEQARQRQQFLMSGVPEELKKQTATRLATQVLADYPPLPTVNHVQQIPEDGVEDKDGIWTLGAKENKLRNFTVPSEILPVSRFDGKYVSKCSSVTADMPGSGIIKSFTGHPALSETVVKQCIQEILDCYPGFPVQAMYNSLKEMKVETEKPPPESESMLKTDMTGILADCTDMVVIDDDDNDDAEDGRKEGKRKDKKGKKSLKLQKKEKSEEINDDKENDVLSSKSAGPALLWTEKYCPAKSSDVVGNAGVLKKLSNWLSEWKHVLDREARKARKLLLKKNKGKLPASKTGFSSADDDWNDDDSDFDSEDSEEEDTLCNTVLLTGPYGCGKTSSVYALALQQGFKVHEVNASSCRSGKQILSQLQEATQSHQVSRQGSHTPRKNAGLAELSAKKKAEPKMPAAFTNLFKKSAVAPVHAKAEEKDGGKKRKRNKSGKDGSPKSKRRKQEKAAVNKQLQMVLEDSSSQTAATRSLNLSSTTLILFDEVDVIFEEDKGFLSAIQSFMSNTKIPIILTTSDLGFNSVFAGRFEHFMLKKPPVTSIGAFLQTLALVENVRTDSAGVLEFVNCHDSDIRQCLVSLQFTILSGGAPKSILRPLPEVKTRNEPSAISSIEENVESSIVKTDKIEDDTKSKDSAKGLHSDDDDFVTLKPLKKRRHFFDEDHSVDSLAADASCKLALNSCSVNEMGSGPNCPPVHCIGHSDVVSTLSQGLKSQNSNSVSYMISVCCNLRRSQCTHIFYSNLHALLPLKCQVVDTFRIAQDASKPQNLRRIKMNTDLYDSEESNDTEKAVNTFCDTDTNAVNAAPVSDADKVDLSREESLCLAKSLSSFADFYETLSSLDVMETKESMQVHSRIQSTASKSLIGCLIDGMENSLPSFAVKGELDMDMWRSFSSEIETRSACTLYQDVTDLQNRVEELSEKNPVFLESFDLPVIKNQGKGCMNDRATVSVPSEYGQACENTLDNLPLITHSNTHPLHLDYMPILRDICRAEQCRLLANTKRRFHHYLDSITLPLKEKSMSTLATAFFQ